MADAPGCASVELIYAPIIHRQLNRHKDNPTDQRQRKKASNAIRRLEEWLERDPAEELRTGVSLTERNLDPTIDFASLHLSQAVEDDWLIATAIEFKRELPEGNTDQVVVVTGDRGLVGKTRHQREITGFRVPARLRLPEEEDQADKVIREQRQRIQALEHAIPKLRLGFAERNEYATIILQPPVELSRESFQAELAAMKQDFRRCAPSLQIPA